MFLEIFLFYMFMIRVVWTNVVRQVHDKLLLDVFVVGQVGAQVHDQTFSDKH